MLLVLLLFLASSQSPCAQQLQQQVQVPTNCSSEEQQVQCGQLPVDSVDAVAVYVQCCQLHEPKPLPAAAEAAAAQATAARDATEAVTPRLDLDLAAGQVQVPTNCSSEEQQVQCGQLPVDSVDAVAVYVQCCQLYEPQPLPAAAQAAAARATAAQGATEAVTPLPDLDLAAGQVQLPTNCSSEEQQVQCGQLPVDSVDAVAIYVQCCQLYEPKPLPPAAQAAAARATAAQAATAAVTPRPDLDLAAGRYAFPPQYYWSSNALIRGQPASGCVAKGTALVPTFLQSRQVLQNVITAPALTSAQIRAVKARGLALTYKISGALRRSAMRMRVQVRRTAPAGTTFVHPAGLMSTTEIALMQFRINRSVTPQIGARSNMLSGESVPPKFYRFNASVVWNPPVNTPISWAPGPYPMAKVATKYGGWEEDTRSCPNNYPPFAPLGICGHVSFVELDGQMVYKQALAFHATKDRRYAQNAFAIITAWANANKQFGGQNGPLQAGWGVAAMARSLELLRMEAAFGPVRMAFVSWFNTYVKPQMMTYIDVSTPAAVAAGNPNVYGNWHATIAEAFMAVSVVTDDTALFTKAVDLFRATTTSYLRWGRDPAYSAGRVLGECTETLRDIYHSEFGLGALLQTAEMAWQQDLDLFSTAGFALVSAMELHARIINAWDAGKQEALLPEGFRFYDTSMPTPPTGTQWVFDIQQQLWNARKPDGSVVSTLLDGVKYLLGVKWLPTGWEIGYNHYVGRLGIAMPETAALIKRYPVEHHEFHWGQGTLTHADTAYQLWRPGLSLASLCR